MIYTKLLAAAIIILVGFLLASLFPKGELGASDDAPSMSGIALRRTTETRAEGRSTTEQVAATASSVSTSPLAQPLANWPEPSRLDMAAAGLREPPPMPAEYAALANDDASRPAQAPPPPSRNEMGSADGGPARTSYHHVVDGDTLARLAALYLGDATLGPYIVEANGGGISDPLPIGAELEIPTRSRITELAQTVASAASSERIPGARTRLVPVAPPRVLADSER